MKRFLFKSILLFVILNLCFPKVQSSARNPKHKQQNIHKYFEQIRHNDALLTAFFAAMPKGGDLHHHYSGSVYAETYMDYALQQDLYLDTQSLSLSAIPLQGAIRFSHLEQKNQLSLYKERLFQKWSAYHFDGNTPSDKHFFETFTSFSLPAKESMEKGLRELKERAKQEHVSYLETILMRVESTSLESASLGQYNDSLRLAQRSKDTARAQALFEDLLRLYTPKQAEIESIVHTHNQYIQTLHEGLGLDDTTFRIRYQNYVLRFEPPVVLFKDLWLAFESANQSTLIVGVNIVGKENEQVSMQDYWLHMQAFRFFAKRYPKVAYSMHAGELTLGLVSPEELSWHIREAVVVAGAKRIGHGVDIAYEQDARELLAYMKKNNIPIEINLSSNEFILHVQDDKHPIVLYQKAGVPLILSTDDAGVLRTSLTQQFVLLAKRYPNFSYQDIKQIVFQSILYSFIEEPELKQQIFQQLKRDFVLFEQNPNTFF